MMWSALSERKLDFQTSRARDGCCGAQVRPPAVIPTFRMGVPLQVLPALPPIQCPASAPGEAAEDGSSIWAAATPVKDPDGFPSL